MFEKLRALLFEPHYPQRYIGRHRLQPGQPALTLSVTIGRGLSSGSA